MIHIHTGDHNDKEKREKHCKILSENININYLRYPETEKSGEEIYEIGKRIAKSDKGIIVINTYSSLLIHAIQKYIKNESELKVYLYDEKVDMWKSHKGIEIDEVYCKLGAIFSKV